VVDADLGTPVGDLRPRPPVVLVLSHSGAGKAVRLSPVRDYAGSAVRVRVHGRSLDEVLSEPGRWRVLARVGDTTLAEGGVTVEGATARRLAVASPAGS
jgi:hypothetical protein